MKYVKKTIQFYVFIALLLSPFVIGSLLIVLPAYFDYMRDVATLDSVYSSIRSAIIQTSCGVLFIAFMWIATLNIRNRDSSNESKDL